VINTAKRFSQKSNMADGRHVEKIETSSYLNSLTDHHEILQDDPTDLLNRTHS